MALVLMKNADKLKHKSAKHLASREERTATRIYAKWEKSGGMTYAFGVFEANPM